MPTEKGKYHPITCPEGTDGEQKYSSTLSLTLALDGMSVQLHAPAPLSRGKRPGTHCIGGWAGPQTRYPLYRRLGGPPDPV